LKIATAVLSFKASFPGQNIFHSSVTSELTHETTDQLSNGSIEDGMRDWSMLGLVIWQVQYKQQIIMMHPNKR
jgi:hypothetical protein